MAIDLYPHNQEAYTSALRMFEKTNRVAIIHPTGTGKSFIGFKLCEDFPDKTICWISPSKYIFKTQLENLKKSSNNYVPKNIKFFTYAKLLNLDVQEIAQLSPSYIILDEFHHCGAEEWGKGISTLLSVYATIPILGLSATSIRYLDNQRDMVEELFDGNVASEITLGEAITKGILSPPKYVLAIYSYQKDLERYEKRVRAARSKVVRDSAEKYLEALRRALEKADGLDVIFKKHISNKSGKYIVFCSNYEHMQEMISMVPNWFSSIDTEPHIYSVYSNIPEASQAFSDFKADTSEHLKLLFCIDMLNEGVHIDDISGVILLRPTVSPTVYKQQVGRAMSVSNENAVIFDVVLNIENLYSYGLIEDEMEIATAYYRSLGLDDEIVNEHFTIVDEVKECTDLFNRLNETLTASWDLMYKHAESFYKKNGHLELSSKYRTEDGYSLGNWLYVQRRIKSGQVEGKLTEEQIAKLEKIGMVWETLTEQNWTRYYEAAKRYYEANGNLDVKARYITDDKIPLGQWLMSLRTYEKSGIRFSYLTDERKNMLNSIGMIWSALDYYWERNYASAKEYFKENGHLNVPASYVDAKGIRLGAWICKLRGLYNNKGTRGTPLNEEQIARLDAIGMIWVSIIDCNWEKGFAEAREYALQHNTLIMSNSYVTPSGYNLGTWMARQKKVYKEGKLSAERKQRLDSLGVEWLSKDPWLYRYELVLKYFEENDEITIPQNVVVDGVWIGKWFSDQKKRNNKGLLSYEQVELLNKINIDLIARKNKVWHDIYEEIFDFYTKYGHINIPSDMLGTNTGVCLSNWLKTQRQVYNRGELNDEQIDLLNRVRFIWVLETSWEEGYRHAKEYYLANGDLSMNQKYKCPDGYSLGRWVSDYRKAYKGEKNRKVITDEQIKALEEIGMDWQRIENQKLKKLLIWNENFEEVLNFYQKFNRCPKNNGGELNEQKMFTWLTNQRKNYRHGYLTQEKLKKLSKIGITEEWLQEQPSSFDKGFSVAKLHFDEYGSLNVPSYYQHKSGFWLGSWIYKIRGKRDSLTKEQIEKLNSIGFVWDEVDPFEEKFFIAEGFYLKHGFLPLEPKLCRNENEMEICRWLKNQMLKRKKGALSQNQIDRLTAIGMDWLNSRERAWILGFSHAKKYYETNGDLNVKVSYVCSDDYPLGEWLHTQRKNRKTLSEEKKNKLIEIGAKGIDFNDN